MHWTTACPDWRERLLARRSLVPCAPLFQSEADAALEIFKALKVVDVAGVPTFGEIGRPWILDFVSAIFGAYDPETGRRLINQFFLLISKKNGKSTTAAGIMITALLLNWRKSAEYIILAPTIEVAKNSAEPAMDMVNEDPELRTLLKPIPHQRAIEHLNTGATLKIVAADDNVVGGKKATGILIDELWLFGKMPRAEDMLREATGGLASRPEGFVIALSTQSNEPPAGVFKDWLHRFRDIRDGKFEAPRSMGLLYEFPEDMMQSGAFREPENFYITNPNLGASVDNQYLLDSLQTARQQGQKSLVGFFAKHLNVEVGIAMRSDSWPGAEFWKRQADKSITLDTILDRCDVVVVGLDGGGLDDLYGLNVLGREKTETEFDAVEDVDGVKTPVRKKAKRWLNWSHAWCHKIVLERRKSIASVLEGFAQDGDLTIVDDDLGDIGQMIEIIQKVKDSGLLYCVAADPAGIGEMVDALDSIGITQDNKENGQDFLVGASQGYAMMNAIKTGERRLANGTLVHADQPLMDWAVGNLKIEPTATAIRATKQNAGDAKIDPVMAMFDAIEFMSRNPQSSGSVYEDRGLIFV